MKPAKKISEEDFDEVFKGADAIETDPDGDDDAPITNRGRAAANMWVAGADYQWIATRFGYSSPARARAAVEKVLAGAYEPSDYGSARNGARARLSKMLQVASKHAFAETIERLEVDEDRDRTKKWIEPNPEQLKWFQGLLAVNDRMIRLDGLDAPARLELHTPEAAELDALVRGLVARSQGQRQIEGDPFGDDELDEIVIEDDDADEQA